MSKTLRSERLVLFAGAALCLLWAFYVPYSAQRLYGSIPPGATAAGAHLEPSHRWKALLQSHWVGHLAPAMGIESDDLRDLARSRSMQRLVSQLAPRELVWGYLPADTGYGSPAWIMSSWMGGRSQFMRWALSLGWGAAEVHRGVDDATYWTWPLPDLPEGQVLSFVLEEGVVIGCVTEPPLNVTHFLRGYERRVPLFPHDASWAARQPPHHQTSAKDRYWFVSQETPDPAERTYVEIQDMTERDLRGRVHSVRPWSPMDQPQEARAAEFAQLVGRSPMAVCSSESFLFYRLIRPHLSEAWQEALANVFPKNGKSPVLLALAGGPLSGRLYRIKVPGLVAAIHAENPRQHLEALQAGIQNVDAANEDLQLFAKPKTSPGGHPYFVLSAMEDEGLYGRPSSERPAFAVKENWFLVTSNGATLEGVLDQPAAGSLPSADWAPYIDTSTASGWFDFTEMAGTLRAAIKFYALKSFMDGPEEMKATRDRLRVAEAWLAALEPLRFGTFSMESRSTGSNLHFSLGEQDGT